MQQPYSLQTVRSAAPQSPVHQSEAVIAGPLVFTSAQLATDWVHGIALEAKSNPEFPYFESDIVKQTDYILRALSRTLQAAGSSLQHVVKAHVFLTDCTDFLGFDRVWNLFFKEPPSRTTVGINGLLVPGARIEISLIAIVPGHGVERQPAHSNAPRPMTKKVEAMAAGDFVFTSGQLAHNARDGVPPEAAGVDGALDIRKQSRYTLLNLNQSLQAAGASAEQVIKTQALLLDANQQAEYEAAWTDEFKVSPAYSAVGIGSLLVGGTEIEIDLTAYRGTDTPRRIEVDGRVQAVSCGGFVFTSGILPGVIGSDIAAGLIPHPAYPYYSSAIRVQTEEVVKRLKDLLTEAGSGLEQLVKVQVFLTDMADFEVFDQVWRSHFGVPPARSVVKTSGLPLAGARIAIEGIALLR